MPDGITANAGGREYASSGARMIPPIPAQNRTGARCVALVMRWLVRIAALLTAAVLIFLIGYILVMGIPNLKPSLFEWTYNSENVSLVPSLINTVLMTAFSLVIATPLGIFAAVWLVEYAKRGNKLVKVVARHHRNAAGHPSIVFGLFGMLFFVSQLHWGYSLIAVRVHAGHHGTARHHAHHRGSPACRAGFLPRRLVRPGRGQAAHRVHHCAAPPPCRAFCPALSWPWAALWARPPR